MKSSIANAFTVDVEDYFQVSAFEEKFPREIWDKQQIRVERNMDRLMALMDTHGIKGTFFILGWIADRYPQLIKQIAENKHEVASHGYWHRRATSQSPEEFQQDVSDTRKLLQDISGMSVNGYRAPSFSINRSNEWAYDRLAEAGYTYSSSIYPVKHDHYGVPDAPRFQYKTPQELWEIPLSTLKVSGKNIPISGGGYFRLYPYRLSAWAIRRFLNVEAKPYIFYMHPWEIDPQQPRQDNISAKTRFRHYLNLKKFEKRLDNLFSEFQWGTMESIIKS